MLMGACLIVECLYNACKYVDRGITSHGWVFIHCLQVHVDGGIIMDGWVLVHFVCNVDAYIMSDSACTLLLSQYLWVHYV